MEIKEIKTEKEVQMPQKTEQDYIEVDLDVLIKAGVIEREVEVAGIRFTLRTLTEEERQKVEELTNDGLPIDDPKHVLNSKVPMLAFAITKINGKPVPPEKRSQLTSTLYKMQSYILDQLFIKYMEMVRDQMTLTEQSVKGGR
jgi:mannose/cellobiose epimerase-like protein (N-acyl-D-glucosamine 2-epimerase family)